MCLCLASISDWPQSSPKLLKNQFSKKSDSLFSEEKPPIDGKKLLTEKFLNFATKDSPAHGFAYSCQVFRKSVKAELTERLVIFFAKKRLVFCPFLCGFWSDLAKNFTASLFSNSPSLCHVLSKSVQFSRRYIRKCLPDSLQYRREAYRLPTITWSVARFLCVGILAACFKRLNDYWVTKRENW